jgi:hypothetical protein
MRINSNIARLGAALLATALLVSCAAWSEPEGEARKEIILALDADMQLIRVNAGQPRRVLARQRVTGLEPGEKLVGIDYRIARGELYALANSGRLYRMDATTGALRPVGTVPAAIPLSGALFGFDFNPAADRIRVVGENGLNLRLHPDTGAAVDGNPAQDGVQPDTPLSYAPGDAHAGKRPAVVAAAYTYNKNDEKITTNFAIDRQLGVLVMQGSKEGATPVVSPNTGRLLTVGPLGLGELGDVSFDIADVSGAAFAAIRSVNAPRTRLFQIDLMTGRASLLGTVGDGAPLLGIAVMP